MPRGLISPAGGRARGEKQRDREKEGGGGRTCRRLQVVGKSLSTNVAVVLACRSGTRVHGGSAAIAGTSLS